MYSSFEGLQVICILISEVVIEYSSSGLEWVWASSRLIAILKRKLFYLGVFMVQINATQGLVLFVDVAGSTQLYESLGDVAAYTKISTCLAQLGDIVARYGGIVVKHIGDEVLCFFEDVVAGIRAGIVAQIEMHTVSGNISLPVRIGCHFGPILVRNNDLFGDTVNIAAHLASMAKASHIMTSKVTLERYEADRHQHVCSYQVHASLNFDQPLKHRFLTRFSPKGKQFQVNVHAIQWELFLEDMVADWTYVQPLPDLNNPPESVLVLEGLGNRYILDQKSLLVGRVQSCDIQVNNRNVSRQHGFFELVGGQVKYTDQSSNGTYVRFSYGKPQFIHRSQTLLVGAGSVSFGVPFDTEEGELSPFKFWFESL